MLAPGGQIRREGEAVRTAVLEKLEHFDLVAGFDRLRVLQRDVIGAGFRGRIALGTGRQRRQ